LTSELLDNVDASRAARANVPPYRGGRAAAVASDPPLTSDARRRAISFRSIAVGTIGAAMIAGLTPYNDLIVGNTPLTGSFFPPAITITVLVLVALNTLLRRFAPSRAFSGGESAVVMAMLLVACAVPGNGLMRYLVPLPVTFTYIGQNDEGFKTLFDHLGLPQWLFAGSGRAVSEFYGRTPEGGTIPWSAWPLPLLGWGSFVACMYAALLSLAPILREQWAVRERLAFPLAEVGTMLVEAPSPGRIVNKLLGNRAFWITAGIVFVIHSLTALHAYEPTIFPDPPLQFDLSHILTEPPWSELSAFVKKSTIYFTFVGIAYFVPSRVGFSLWAAFLIEQFAAMGVRSAGGDVPNGIWNDQHLGACVAMLVSILWVGRHVWLSTLKQAFGAKPQNGDSALGGWARTFLIAVVGMFVWLFVVGVGPLAATVIVATVLAVHVIVARVVTETGLPFVRIMPTVPQIASNFPPSLVSGRDIFFGGTSTLFGAMSTRESLLPHTLHGLQIARADEEGSPSSRGLIGVLVWALAVAICVAAVSTLWCQYRYAFPLNNPTAVMENQNGAIDVPTNYVAANVVEHAAGKYTAKTYNSGVQIGIGAGVTFVLQACVLRFAGWPLMPVGYLISHTWYAQMAWWSICLGWLAKVIILRFGGAKAYANLKPIFVGLVVGEAISAGVWLIVAVVLVWLGHPYQVVNFLPS